MAAYRSVGKLARSTADLAGVAPQPAPLVDIVMALTEAGLSPEFVPVAHQLKALRDAVAHDGVEISAKGALSFITAAERLADALLKLRRTIKKRARFEDRRARAVNADDSPKREWFEDGSPTAGRGDDSP
jgi:hypothetical protein